MNLRRQLDHVAATKAKTSSTSSTSSNNNSSANQTRPTSRINTPLSPTSKAKLKADQKHRRQLELQQLAMQQELERQGLLQIQVCHKKLVEVQVERDLKHTAEGSNRETVLKSVKQFSEVIVNNLCGTVKQIDKLEDKAEATLKKRAKAMNKKKKKKNNDNSKQKLKEEQEAKEEREAEAKLAKLYKNLADQRQMFRRSMQEYERLRLADTFPTREGSFRFFGFINDFC